MKLRMTGLSETSKRRTRVFLTGATGFIGAPLARRLIKEGCDVTALVKSSSNRARLDDIASSLHWIEGDILALESYSDKMAASKPDICFHLAWYVEPKLYLTSSRNLDMMMATFQLAYRLGEIRCKKLVVAGTCFEYDTETGYLSETSPTHPRSIYGASKLSTYTILRQIALQSEMSLAWARLFYQYGPFEDPRRLVPFIINSILRGEEVKTTKGEQIRDFLHVDDVASALWEIGKSRISGPVNIGSSHPIFVRDIILSIAKALGKTELVKFGSIPYDPSDPMFVCAINRKLREQTGWSPRYSLESGLLQTIDWWKNKLLRKA